MDTLTAQPAGQARVVGEQQAILHQGSRAEVGGVGLDHRARRGSILWVYRIVRLISHHPGLSPILYRLFSSAYGL
jgi:hypothetical protein